MLNIPHSCFTDMCVFLYLDLQEDDLAKGLGSRQCTAQLGVESV